MKGKKEFTKQEISRLEVLINERCNAPSCNQKKIRDKMRKIGFYGRDDFNISNMTINKFRSLIANGDIKVIEDKMESISPHIPLEHNEDMNLHISNPISTNRASCIDDYIIQLKSDGFSGFITIDQLIDNPKCVTTAGGVYMILRDNTNAPKFLEEGTGGFFDGKNPNVSVEKLHNNWIPDTPILYIGKSVSLQKRLKQYMQFGIGKSAGHYGGRYIWQLEDNRELIVCWKPIENCDPRKIEEKMIQQFKEEHSGRRPFANLED